MTLIKVKLFFMPKPCNLEVHCPTPFDMLSSHRARRVYKEAPCLINLFQNGK